MTCAISSSSSGRAFRTSTVVSSPVGDSRLLYTASGNCGPACVTQTICSFASGKRCTVDLPLLWKIEELGGLRREGQAAVSDPELCVVTGAFSFTGKYITR